MLVRTFIGTVVLLCAVPFAYTQNTNKLQQQIAQLITASKATVGLSMLHLENNQRVSINADKHYPMLSVFKFHTALTVMHKVDNGELSLKQMLHLKKSDLLENTWSPFREKYPDADVSINLKEAIEWMVITSDNNMCDVLLRLVGGIDTVDSFINSPDFVIKNNEEAMHESWGAQFLNTTTPGNATLLLKQFYEQKLLTKKSSRFLYKTMVANTVGQNRMKAKLPVKTIVAHRTGTSFTNDAGLTGAVNNIGIVTLPNGDHVAIAVFVHNTTAPVAHAEALIADITKVIWNFYARE